MNKITQYFFNNIFHDMKDHTKIAKTKITIHYSVFLLFITLLILPFVFSYNAIELRYIGILLSLLSLLPFISFYKTKSYSTTAVILSCSLYVNVTVHALFANGALAPSLTIWYFIIINFASDVLSKRQTVFFTILSFGTISLLSLLFAFDVININHYYTSSLDNFPKILILLALTPLYLKLQCANMDTKKEAIDFLEEKIKEKSMILGIVAHDLRNPLGSINNLIELIRIDMNDNEYQFLESYLQLLEESSSRVLCQIEELVDVARNENSEINFSFDLIAMDDIVESAVRHNRSKAHHKKVALNLSIVDKGINVYLDNIKFGRVVDNLLSNAIKFSRKGGIIDITVEKKNTWIELTVRDTGVGIPFELHERLFERFTPSGRNGTYSEHSIGLGLSIVKDIVTKHSGTLDFISTPNVGTTFFIRIPVVVD